MLLDGLSCEQFRGSQWRLRVGYLPAISQWWGESVREHFPAERDLAECSLWLERLTLRADILDAATATLSSGERQRLALIRLLANHPQVLLLDEPTASLDPGNTDKVEALVAEYRSQYPSATIWVSHEPRQLQRVATRHFVLEAGALKSGGEGRWN